MTSVAGRETETIQARTTARVINCFSYAGQIDLLSTHLRELAGHVDLFVIVESIAVADGSPGRISFNPLDIGVVPFAGSIRHVVVDSVFSAGDAGARGDQLLKAAHQAMPDAHTDDLVLVSDLGVGAKRIRDALKKSLSEQSSASSSGPRCVRVTSKRQPSPNEGDKPDGPEDPSDLPSLRTVQVPGRPPVVICPYLFDHEPAEIAAKFSLNSEECRHIKFFFWQDLDRIGPERAFEHCWNQFPEDDIIIIHSDMSPMPGQSPGYWYDELCRYRSALPWAGMIACNLIYPPSAANETTQVQCAGGTFENNKISHLHGEVTGGLDGKGVPAVFLEQVRAVDWVTFGGLLMRRELLRACGPFDKRYQWAYVMDVDYCFEARLRGFVLVHVPVSLRHEESRTTKVVAKENPQLWQESATNSERFYRKWESFFSVMPSANLLTGHTYWGTMIEELNNVDATEGASYQGEISILSEALPSLLPRQQFTLKINLQNTGTARLRVDGDHPVRFSYHWLNADRTVNVGDGRRTELPHDLLPAGSASFDVVIEPPRQAGTAILQLTLVHEGVAWFEDRGFIPPELSVNFGTANGRRMPSGATPGLIVLGMHRSGSSCLAGMLQSSGFFGGQIYRWNEDNRKGNQENVRVMAVNEAVLVTSGGGWSAPPRDVVWTAEAEIQRDKVLLDFYSSGFPWMFKDPRTLLTLPFWREIIPSPRLLGVFRNPLFVAQSLATRNGASLLSGLELWEAYNSALLREHQVNPFPLVCFDLPRDEFIASVSDALKTICSDLVVSGEINLELLGDFFEEELVHQAGGWDAQLHALHSITDLDAAFAERLKILYNDLCTISGCAERLAEDDGRRVYSSDSTVAQTLGELVKIEKATLNEDFDTAYQICNELVVKFPVRADLWMRLLGLAKKSGVASRVEDTLKRGLLALPEDSYLWLELAKMDWAAKKFDDALISAGRAAEFAEDWLEPKMLLASWMREHKSPIQAHS